MSGMVTEKDFAVADRVFPGIVRFFESLERKPKTFLELVWLFLNAEAAD
jgi:hypothetical protein